MSEGIKRSALISWLDDYLQINNFKDISLNGLQVEGNEIIKRIAVSVDSSLYCIEEAAKNNCNMLITHHGLFWGKPIAIKDAHKKRVKALFDNEISLYTAHLPLDYHKEVGNNAMIANALSLQDQKNFGDLDLGISGNLPRELDLQDFADRIQKLTGEICLVHSGGHPFVHKIAICSGNGADMILEAKKQGLDTLLTGEPEHKYFHDAFENGMNVIYAGHYETETFGVRALAAKIEEEFKIPWQFIHQPTGL